MKGKGYIKRYMTVPEVAHYFSVSRALVYEWVRDGKLQTWHPNGIIGSRGLRVLADSVAKLEQAGTINAADYDA